MGKLKRRQLVAVLLLFRIVKTGVSNQSSTMRSFDSRTSELNQIKPFAQRLSEVADQMNNQFRPNLGQSYRRMQTEFFSLLIRTQSSVVPNLCGISVFVVVTWWLLRNR
ncbi:unnamed protein product [Fasciola hepatica]|uniref:Uncharacterized protein n=1 Tax=Fasciola hepatica TaxID=6192 RepID=A0ABC9HHU0_FASHE